MNRQTLMAVPSAYPAAKASDELLWQELNRAWRDEKRVRSRNAQKETDDEKLCAQSMMPKNIEKMLSTTRCFWAMR